MMFSSRLLSSLLLSAVHWGSIVRADEVRFDDDFKIKIVSHNTDALTLPPEDQDRTAYLDALFFPEQAGGTVMFDLVVFASQETTHSAVATSFQFSSDGEYHEVPFSGNPEVEVEEKMYKLLEEYFETKEMERLADEKNGVVGIITFVPRQNPRAIQLVGSHKINFGMWNANNKGAASLMLDISGVSHQQPPPPSLTKRFILLSGVHLEAHLGKEEFEKRRDTLKQVATKMEEKCQVIEGCVLGESAIHFILGDTNMRLDEEKLNAETKKELYDILGFDPDVWKRNGFEKAYMQLFKRKEVVPIRFFLHPEVCRTHTVIDDGSSSSSSDSSGSIDSDSDSLLALCEEPLMIDDGKQDPYPLKPLDMTLFNKLDEGPEAFAFAGMTEACPGYEELQRCNLKFPPTFKRVNDRDREDVKKVLEIVPENLWGKLVGYQEKRYLGYADRILMQGAHPTRGDGHIGFEVKTYNSNELSFRHGFYPMSDHAPVFMVGTINLQAPP